MTRTFKFPQEASTVGSLTAVYLRVPSQYPTMQAAFDANHNRSIVEPNRFVILIESGHHPAVGLAVSNCIANHFSIESDDVMVTVDPSFTGNLFAFGNCHAPELNAKFDMQHHGEVGYSLSNGSIGSIQDGYGVINAGTIGAEIRTSVCSAAFSQWTGAGTVGIRMEQCASATFDSSNVDNCGQQAIFISRACTFNFLSGSAQNAGTWGIEVRRSIANLDLANFSGAAEQGIWARHGALVSAEGAICDNCGSWGIQASDCSSIYAESSFVRGSVNGVVCGDASTIDLGGATITGLDTPANSIVVNNGSRIDATDCTTDNGTPGLDGNFRAFNSIDGHGIVTDNNRPAITNSEAFISFEQLMADNTATSIAIPGSGGGTGFLVLIATPFAEATGVLYARVNNATIVTIALPVGTLIETAAVVLTGTTGTDGKLTFSTATGDRNLYIENRLGGDTLVGVTIVSLVDQ